MMIANRAAYLRHWRIKKPKQKLEHEIIDFYPCKPDMIHDFILIPHGALVGMYDKVCRHCNWRAGMIESRSSKGHSNLHRTGWKLIKMKGGEAAADSCKIEEKIEKKE